MKNKIIVFSASLFDEEGFILHDGDEAINILGNSEVEAKGNELIQIEKSNRISKTSAGFKTSLF